MPTIAEIFRRFSAEYLQLYGDKLLPSHRRAIRDIVACRTPALGGHRAHCPSCGYEHHSYHSCNNRSCPTCNSQVTERWRRRQLDDLLDVPYFHLVFTVPHELQEPIRSNQKKLYGLLMRCATSALQKLAADPRYIGGKIGILCVLHTWTRGMGYHPHVHCLVPGGGLGPDRVWHESRRKFLVPVQALSIIFRAKFMKGLAKVLPEESLPAVVWEKPWVVYSKPVIQGAEKVVGYLSRYIHRVAITNNRILTIGNDRVTFRYKDSRDSLWKTMTLKPLEFIRRFLQHVPPPRFHKVRAFGLLAPGKRLLLRQIQLFVAPPKMDPDPEWTPNDSTVGEQQPPVICPRCGKNFLVVVTLLPDHARSPP
ncbi:MAG: IS91 family transposase [Dehalococcoidia bacterium]